jgi:signal transduction histidine kinase
MFKRINLFHRVFLHGVLLISALGCAVIVTFHIADNKPNNWFDAFSRAAFLMADTVAPRGASQEALDKELRRFNFVTRASLTVYTADGVKLAEAGDRRLPPLPTDEAKSLIFKENDQIRRIGEIYVPIPSKKEPAYLAIALHLQSDMLGRFAIGLVIALLLIGAVSFPVARSIAKPIQSITAVARRIKDGDLDARVEIHVGSELGVLASALNETARGLKTRIRREKELLANVSHELRTPLARMRVALEIALEPDQDRACILRHVAGIAADVAELEQLVSDVLSAMRLDLTGQETGLSLHLEQVTSDELAKSARERFSRHHERPLNVEIMNGAQCIEVDRSLFLRVIDNLLDNAEKYSPPDAELVLAIYTEDNTYVLKVSDRGEGIPEADLQRVFEPFYRCDKSRNKDIRGIGLGLTLCKRIVEAHGGTIVALSRDGGGTVIRIEIPIR